MFTYDYELIPELVGIFSGGTMHVDDYRVVDVEALLIAGDGTITIDALDGPLVEAFDDYPALRRVGSTGSPAVVIPITDALEVRSAGSHYLDLTTATAGQVIGVDTEGRLALVTPAAASIAAHAADTTDVHGIADTSKLMAFTGDPADVGKATDRSSGAALSVVSPAWLGLARDPDILISGSITRDSNGAATGASVIWPDGDTGTYTATTVSTDFPGAVDAYTITKTNGVTTHTYTQSAVTRDSNGAVTNRPAITVT